MPDRTWAIKHQSHVEVNHKWSHIWSRKTTMQIITHWSNGLQLWSNYGSKTDTEGLKINDKKMRRRWGGGCWRERWFWISKMHWSKSYSWEAEKKGQSLIELEFACWIWDHCKWIPDFGYSQSEEQELKEIPCLELGLQFTHRRQLPHLCFSSYLQIINLTAHYHFTPLVQSYLPYST